jgi:hypothetical protein
MGKERLWALVDGGNACVMVQVATDEWISENPSDDPNLRYVLSPDGPGRASPGYLLDESVGLFAAPKEWFPDDWYFDDDPNVWSWVDPNPPIPPTGE